MPDVASEHPTSGSAGAHLPWHRAATLSERLGGTPSQSDPVRGEKRLAMWRELAPLTGERATLDARLAPLGVGADELAALLGESDASLAARLTDEPDWHQVFRRWWAEGMATTDANRRLDPDMGLLEVIRPLVEGAVHELDALVEECVRTSDDPVMADPGHILDVVRATAPAADLLGHVQRTLVLELNIARVEDRLGGETPEERFSSYVELLRSEGNALALWDEYPVLARLIVCQLRFWIDTRVELIEALVADLPALRESLLAAPGPQRLERLEFGAGDKHRRGRSVAMVEFDTATLVFKPRPLAMDTAFDGLLDWVNRQGAPHDLARIGIVDRGSHGWVEQVDTTATTDAEGGDRYAWRLGALTSLLYLLHATDFHFENVLAAGEYPVLVDLEALLHNDKTAAIVKIDGETDIAAVTLADSVQSVGILPNHLLVRGEDGTFGLDVSGLAGHGGQLTPMPVPTWEGTGTDRMRLVKRRMEMDAERNHPMTADGEPIDLVGRVDSFVEGFTHVYRLLEAGRDELLADQGPLTPFGLVRTRLIARPTHIYGRLLLESTHPDFMRDGLDHSRSLARLAGGHVEMPESRNAMILDEVAELTLGDIPMFTVDAESGTLRGGLDGRPIGTRYPPLTAVRERLVALGDADLAFQARVIRSCVAATAMGESDARWPNWHRPRLDGAADPGDFAEEALRLAHRLSDLCIRDEHGLGWIGLDLVDEKYWQYAPAPIGLYTGTAGIAHALDAVAAVTGDERTGELAQAAFDQVAKRSVLIAETLASLAKKPGAAEFGIGAFGPFGGAVYALAHAAVRHDRPEYAEAAAALLPAIDELVDEDPLLDIVSGSAGAILALLSLETARPGIGAARIAERCAGRLLATRQERGEGWGWATPINPEEPLAGFSHGASGIAYAFARLDRAAPRPEYKEAVRHALTYERTAFDPELRTWRDLRPANLGGRTVMNAWCHGAPGIAMARNAFQELGTVPELAELIESDRHMAVLAAISTGLDLDPVSGLGNHSLCHGDIGNLLIIDESTRADQEPEVAGLLPRVWNTLLHEGRENGWLCGVPKGVETPGLMTGLAGIAWGLARKAAPERVPDLLTLAAPDTRGKTC
ncbi:type 2 lanthipeptide synthetase LanM family protein [Streptomyces sp. Wh19]|uniref:type 2 lanthipeptide synthetase LanM family protein n=1 Tax=Streptomyces sp. Wh19 TaxID=3076629 RepID=UPI002958BD00|nr:type 2 lanthipeptide synthetase LanM family protein [Streptomyces sp. Wh19]MDV9199902.1 type 2 lanthipeptide synthetase LanM family protein [Streptomyces sp. Wh19]